MLKCLLCPNVRPVASLHRRLQSEHWAALDGPAIHSGSSGLLHLPPATSPFGLPYTCFCLVQSGRENPCEICRKLFPGNRAVARTLLGESGELGFRSSGLQAASGFCFLPPSLLPPACHPTRLLLRGGEVIAFLAWKESLRWLLQGKVCSLEVRWSLQLYVSSALSTLPSVGTVLGPC